jgi:hypothetical protein
LVQMKECRGEGKAQDGETGDRDAEEKVKHSIAGTGDTDAEEKVKHRNAGTRL